MNPRLIAALAVGLTSVTAGHALAAPVKKACKIVTDDPGDTFAFRSQDGSPAAAAGPQEEGFDVLSGDIVSNGKVITAVIRVKKFSDAITTAPQGAGFAFDFTTPTFDDNIQASMRAVFIKNQPAYYEVTYKDGSIPNSPSTFLATATGSVDKAKNEIHITAPVSAFSTLGVIKAGTTLSPASDSVTSGRAVPPSPGTAGQPVATRYVFADVALGGKSIKVGAPSCVTPGK